MDLAIIRKILQDLRAMFRYDPSIWDDTDPEGLPTSNAEPSPEPSPSTSYSSSTVTNFWVSCTPTNSDSSSCTTTSSSLVAGCAASATITRPGSCSTQEESVDQGEHVMYSDADSPSSTTVSATINPQPLQLRPQHHLATSKMRIPIEACIPLVASATEA